MEAGSDTTSSFTQSLILALVNFPEVQEKAHEELDRVIGNDRRPHPDDLEHLPYIRAIINEVHRFRPNTPLIPHAATADVQVSSYNSELVLCPDGLCFQFENYILPTGSILFANLCKLLAPFPGDALHVLLWAI